MKAYKQANAHLQKAIEIFEFLVENASEPELIEIGLLLFEGRSDLQHLVNSLKVKFITVATQFPVVLDGEGRAQMVCTPQDKGRNRVTFREQRE